MRITTESLKNTHHQTFDSWLLLLLTKTSSALLVILLHSPLPSLCLKWWKTSLCPSFFRLISSKQLNCLSWFYKGLTVNREKEASHKPDLLCLMSLLRPGVLLRHKEALFMTCTKLTVAWNIFFFKKDTGANITTLIIISFINKQFITSHADVRKLNLMIYCQASWQVQCWVRGTL